jgi:hypothetical protein
MIVHSVLKRGTDHPDFCQDFCAIGETPNFLYAAIFDGCSGGTDSHFASTLFQKTFKDVLANLHEMLNREDGSIENNAKFLVYMMSRKMNEVKQVLHLETVELLSTLILCTINKNTRECLITAFGDGYYHVDGTEAFIKNTRFLHKENGENMPDYIAYDLDAIANYGDFETWFASKSEKHRFENVKNVSIASDGIDTFKTFKETAQKVNPVDYLVKDEELLSAKKMLAKKCNKLYNIYCMAHTDDLSLIRIKFDD